MPEKNNHGPEGRPPPRRGCAQGNLNGLKIGEYSMQMQTLQAAFSAMPMTAGLLADITGKDRC